MRNCPICGGKTEMKNIKGRHFPWKHYKSIQVTQNFPLLTCTSCNEILIKGSEIKELDKVMEISSNECGDPA